MDDTTYVMVPVPQQFVPDVMRHVLELSVREAVAPWDEPALQDLFADLDEVQRSVLSIAARAALDDAEAGVESVADDVQLSQKEVLAVARDINVMAGSLSRDELVAVRTAKQTLPSGREVHRRVMAVDRPVAEMLRRIETAERDADPRLPRPIE